MANRAIAKSGWGGSSITLLGEPPEPKPDHPRSSTIIRRLSQYGGWDGGAIRAPRASPMFRENTSVLLGLFHLLFENVAQGGGAGLGIPCITLDGGGLLFHVLGFDRQ